MKNKLRETLRKISHGKLEPVFYHLYNMFIQVEYNYLKVKWYLSGLRKPDKEEIELVRCNVTFIYKSFERQRMAKRLYRNIQSYYPGVKVIIADDSSKPLDLKDEYLEVIQLPFNSGLSYGLNRALEKVTTPYLMRMDDDELLTPNSRIGEQLKFLFDQPFVDIVSFGVLSTPKLISPEIDAKNYYVQPMNHAPKRLKIPHMTMIDKTHIVLGKTPNIFIGRTDSIKLIGWDDNIRMIDHNEFFTRAAGNLVSVMDPTTSVFHYHNQFDSNYQKYRSDVNGDRIYIMNKYRNYIR